MHIVSNVQARNASDRFVDVPCSTSDAILRRKSSRNFLILCSC